MPACNFLHRVNRNVPVSKNATVMKAVAARNLRLEDCLLWSFPETNLALGMHHTLSAVRLLHDMRKTIYDVCNAHVQTGCMALRLTEVMGLSSAVPSFDHTCSPCIRLPL